MHAVVAHKQKAQSPNRRKANEEKGGLFCSANEAVLHHPAALLDMQLHSIGSCPAKILSLLFA